MGVEQVLRAVELDEVGGRPAQVGGARLRVARVGDDEAEHRARVGGLARGAGRLGDRERLLRRARAPPRGGAAPTARTPPRPAAARARRGRSLGQPPQRLAVGGQAAVALERLQPPEPLEEAGGARGVGRAVEPGQRLLAPGDRLRVLAGVAREVGEVAEQLDPVQADAGIARPPATARARCAGGAAPRRRRARPRPPGPAATDARSACSAHARRAPVDGQLGVGAGVADRLGDGAVDRRPLPRQQVGVDGLAHDVVAERERVALAVVDEQVVVDRVAQRGRELRLDRARGRAEQPGAGRAADRRRVGQQPPGRLGHAPQPHAQRVRQPGGELLAAGIAVGGEQLLGEQRVAAAALVQLGGQRGLGRAAEDALELGGHALAAERRQLRQHHAVVVLQLGEHLADRVGAAQLAGAEADRHGQALPAQAAHEEAHELARGAVDPVDVLEDHEHRRRGARARRAASRSPRTRAPARNGQAANRRRPAARSPGAGTRARARRGPPGPARPAPPRAPRDRRRAAAPRAARTAGPRRPGAGTRRAAPPSRGRGRAARPHAAGGSCRCPPHR